MAKALWAGLDVGIDTTCVCILNDIGQVVHEATCPTVLKAVHRELLPLRRRKHARVGMEAATGVHLARGLRNLGYDVDVYEQRQLSKFLRIRRNKTDAGDANGIAEAGRIGAMVSKVHLKTLECQLLQSRLTIRRHLIRQRVRLSNLLGRQLDQYGGRLRRRKLANFRVNVEAELRKVFGRAPSEFTRELNLLVDRCEALIAYQRQVDAELRRIALDTEVCRRFMAIPGVGVQCALTFYASVCDPHRFRRSAAVGPYFGLAPTVKQSGSMLRVGRISKMGNTATRTLLVNAAMCFLQRSAADDEVRLWAAEVERRGTKMKARVALARKLATIMIAMWKSGEPYRQRTVRVS